MIQGSYSPIVYATTGSVNTFPILFEFQFDSDLVVTLTDLATSAVTTLVLNVDYTATGGGSPAEPGTLVTGTTYAADFTITIARSVPFTQLTSWQENDAYPANSHRVENALDKLTMLFQQAFGGLIPPGQLGTGSADSAHFLRGDSTWANTLIGALGAFTVGADSITVMTVGQSAAAAFRIVSGVNNQASLYFGQDASANPFEMRLTYDPTLAATGFAGTGAMHQLFYANGDVDWSGFHYDFASGFVGIGTASPTQALDIVGNCNVTGVYTGHADGSLITSGQVLPAFLASNSPSPFTFLRSDGTWQTVSGGGGTVTTTTGTFTIAAVSSPQTVPVTSTAGLPIGTYIYISDGTHTIIGQITNIASLNLTVVTQQIVAGSAGNTMATGAAVALNVVPGSNAVLAEDAIVSPSTMSTLNMLGQKPVGSTIGKPMIDLFIDSSAAGTIGVRGQINPAFGGGSVLITDVGSGTAIWQGPVFADTVVAFTGGFTSFTKVTAAMLLASGTRNGTTYLNGNDTWSRIAPDALATVTGPTNGQVPSYNSSNNTFLWVDPSTPSGGDNSQFLRGDGVFSNFVNQVTGLGGTIFGPSEATNSYGTYVGFVGSVYVPPTGFNAKLDFATVQKGVSTWSLAGKSAYQFSNAALAVKLSGTAAYVSIDSANVEVAQFGGTNTNFVSDIVRAGGFRSGAGYWQYAFTLDAPGASVTVDLKNGAYQRHTGIANNVSVTLADSTPAPTASNYQYANELTLEINAPGSFTYTWPGTVTWANGAAAPTLNTTGINVLKFIRRQGQAQWLGYVVNISGGTSYTNAMAQDAVGGILSNAGDIQFTYTAHTSISAVIGNGKVTDAKVAAGISPSKLLGYPGNAALFLNGAGGWTAGVAFNPGTSYTWTAAQTFNASNTFNAQQVFNMTYGALGSSTISTRINDFYPNILFSDAAALAVAITDNQNAAPGAGGIKVADLQRTVTAATHGCNSFSNQLDLRSTLVDGFSIGFTTITMSKRITGTANADGTWLNSWGPCHLFSATPDATGVIHTWTTGGVRAGEVNYGNAWQDWGLVESALGSNYCTGLTFVPDWLAGNTGATTENHYDAQFAIGIGYAGPDPHGHAPQNHCGIFFFENAISPGGYAIRIRGATSVGYSGGFNGNTPTVNAAGALIKMSDTCKTGIDFAGTTGDSTVCTATNTGNPMITMADDQSIKLGSIWIRGHSGALQVSTDGTSWTSVTIP